VNIGGEAGLSSSPSIKVIMKDEFVDDVLALLKLLTARKGWNNEARLNQKKLWALLDSKDYITFTAGYSDYIASAIGDSYLYDVPMYKRGYLAKYRGKRVRVVCVASGSNRYRDYMVGVVGDTPPDKLITKVQRK
jgi:hypothetical protein